MIAELPDVTISRRSILQRTAVTAVTALVIPVMARAQDEKTAAGAGKKDVCPFLSWVRIDTTGKITLLSSRSEMGQGISSALPMVLAEELCVDWQKIHIEQAPTDAKLFGSQGTGGSGSVTASWMPLRLAGAAARQMLIHAAAQEWHVSPADCAAQDGVVSHGGRTASYASLVEAASRLPVPEFSTVPLKKPADFEIIGKIVPRKDIPAKTDGTAQFGIDVRVPGMKFAMVERPAIFGAKVKSFDATAAKAVPGVVDVFQIPAVADVHSCGGIAVVADSTWIAMKARKALKIEWEPGPHASESSDSLRKQFRRIVDTPQKVILNQGDADTVISTATPSKKVEADYELPFQAHACMEPMNCTVVFRNGGAEVWAPAQGPEWVQGTVAQVGGLKPEQVKVNITLMGGGFGRRYQADFAAEAAQVAKKLAGTPVQLVWSREDDMTHDFYRPASYHRISGALDDQGKILAWKHRSTSTPISEWWDPKAPPESSEMGCTLQMPYAMKNYKLEFAPAESGVPRAWWRSVEASFIGFVMESYMDELAHQAGADPLEFRLRHLDATRKVPNALKADDGIPLDCGRMRAVLQLAADKAGWGAKLPAGEALGIACHYSFNSYAANVAHVAVKDGKLEVKRIVSAVDIGTPVAPEGIRAQVESAVVYGLTAALKSQITIENGRSVQSNFNKFACLKMNETPHMQVHIIPSQLAPTGIGEPGLPPVAPAVMNAVFAATGKRIRRLPVMPEDLRS
jgi:isoquinoline 1-oxidoreductase beta subunit